MGANIWDVAIGIERRTQGFVGIIIIASGYRSIFLGRAPIWDGS